MTEVTRIACPGCRIPLQFRPEALDFPANCAACECRFSVGIYVRLSCPKCHQGSKIRESYRGRRVRCIRCQHDFLSDEGIPADAGGRILVARMLDTDSPVPPETVQPFVRPDREEPERRPDPPETDWGPDAGPATVSGSGVWAISRSVELERLRAEVEELRGRHNREVASARKAAQQADHRWSTAEGKLVEAMLEVGEAEQRTARLLSERDEALHAAKLERSALLSRIDRLNAAVSSAAVGESEAQRLAEESLRKFDAAADDLRSEQRRRLEIGRVVEELRAEIQESRAAEAARGAARIELEGEIEKARGQAERLLKENEDLAELVEHLLGENQAMGEEAGQLRAENRRMSDEVGEARRSFQELERKAGLADESGRLREVNRRLTVAIEQARREAESLQSKLALELERAIGESGYLREDREHLAVEIGPALRENGRLQGENDRLSGELDRIAREPCVARKTSGPMCQTSGEDDAALEASPAR
jgi:hypothetical protein